MTETTVTEKQDAMPSARLGDLAAAVGAYGGRGPAPVESWHPPSCGAIEMRIAADGTWFYQGSPITRRPLVELFARILRRDDERYVLVTPAECVGIVVDDVPFAAVALAHEDGLFRFVTNVGDEVDAGSDHPMRFESDPDGGVRPYVHVRGGLWARLTRSLAIDLLGAATTEMVAGREALGIRSGEVFFAIEGTRPKT